ncbi:SH3 domain-containing protein [Pseudomonas koreensis]|uniref:SH3 domain-containing protein n=1 Tax=Pseudomonas koreensis TaxID=198620 RepID=UPI0021CAC236|nr:SH3 domain-containing protein [Pseudomonas koreensis]MCU0092448.1 SH3 domain-containing protein [Pseudomonas koreensis]
MNKSENDHMTPLDPEKASPPSDQLRGGDQLRRLVDYAKTWSAYDQMRQLAEQAKTWSSNDQLRQLAEKAKAWSGNDQLRQLAEQAKAWGSDDQLRQLSEQAKAWSGDNQMRQLAEQASAWGGNDQLRQLAEQAKSWSNNDQLRQLAEQAKSWSNNDQLRQLAEQAKYWSGNDQLRQLADQAKYWARSIQLKQLGEQALTLGLTFDSVVGELVARSEKSREPVKREQISTDIRNLEFIEEPFIDEGGSASINRQALSKAPTWLLYFWLVFVAPALYVLANWDTLRTNLVDINGRIPQTSTGSKLRNFIRTELAGKPGDFRLVTRSDVRMRTAPGIKSETIMKLSKDAVVIVLEKEDRTWLYVSYEHDGFLIDGYMSNKFLKKIRK